MLHVFKSSNDYFFKSDKSFPRFTHEPQMCVLHIIILFASFTLLENVEKQHAQENNNL